MVLLTEPQAAPVDSLRRDKLCSNLSAFVVELVDTTGLNPVAEKRAGSIPVEGIR
jgi:hypothetical protein